MAEPFRYDAYISHSPLDLRFCRKLLAALDAAGARVWYDEHDHPTDDLTPESAAALRSSRHLVVVLSPAALASVWVEHEVRSFHGLLLARASGARQILPVVARSIAGCAVWEVLDQAAAPRVSGPADHPLRPRHLAIQVTLSRLGLLEKPAS